MQKYNFPSACVRHTSSATLRVPAFYTRMRFQKREHDEIHVWFECTKEVEKKKQDKAKKFNNKII